MSRRSNFRTPGWNEGPRTRWIQSKKMLLVVTELLCRRQIQAPSISIGPGENVRFPRNPMKAGFGSAAVTTMAGGNFRPSAVTARITETRILSLRSILTATRWVPRRATTYRGGMSNHTDVSSTFTTRPGSRLRHSKVSMEAANSRIFVNCFPSRPRRVDKKKVVVFCLRAKRCRWRTPETYLLLHLNWVAPRDGCTEASAFVPAGIHS